MSPDIIAAIAAGLGLIFIHALPWLTPNSAPIVQNPAKLVAALSAIQVVPHYFVVMIWPSESMIFPILGNEVGPLLTKFAVFYSLSIIALLYGVKVGIGAGSPHKPLSIKVEPNYYFASFFAFFVYLASMYFIISQNFSLSEFISMVGTQRELQAGTGFLYIFKTPAAYLAILFMAVQHARTGKPSFAVVASYIILIVMIESTLGSRRTPIQLILFAIIAVQMVRPGKKLLSTTNVLLAGVCLSIFVVLLNLRDAASGVQEPRSIASYIVNFSYNDIYMFIMLHFSYYDFWYGSVFLDFKYRFTGGIGGFPPPPIDEGVYIYNLFLGRPVAPPMSNELMAANSWPPRTFGNGYMNFGLFGVLAFSALQGWLTGLSYRYVQKTGGHPIFLFLFLLFVFSFQVSNLKLAELFTVFVGLTVVFGPLYLIERRALREASIRRL